LRLLKFKISAHVKKFALTFFVFLFCTFTIGVGTCYSVEIVDESTNIESMGENVPSQESSSEANSSSYDTQNNNDYPNKSMKQALRDSVKESLIDSTNRTKELLVEGTNRAIDNIIGKFFESLKNSQQFQQQSKPEFEDKKIIEQVSIQESGLQSYVRIINARVTQLGFFESDFNPTNSLHRHQYRERFNKSESRYIFWEIILEYPPPTERMDYYIESKWYDTNNNLIYSNTSSYFIIPKTWQSYNYDGHGRRIPGHFESGKYRVELYSNGENIAVGSFEID
jgi:hypothetical protein